MTSHKNLLVLFKKTEGQDSNYSGFYVDLSQIRAQQSSCLIISQKINVSYHIFYACLKKAGWKSTAFLKICINLSTILGAYTHGLKLGTNQQNIAKYPFSVANFEKSLKSTSNSVNLFNISWYIYRNKPDNKA